MISNVDLAIYSTVHHFKDGELRGAVGLAEALGKNAGTFSNKANPGMPGHYFSPAELIAIMNRSGDYQPLHAINHACHHSAIPVGDYSACNDIALLDVYAMVHAEIGETSAAIRKAFLDGQIDRAEFDEIDREFTEDFQAMLALRARLESLVVD